jgi:hypothetical protein
MEEKEKRKNELYSRMKVIRLNQHETLGDQFRYVRGEGLVKRDESVNELGEKK